MVLAGNSLIFYKESKGPAPTAWVSGGHGGWAGRVGACQSVGRYGGGQWGQQAERAMEENGVLWRHKGDRIPVMPGAPPVPCQQLPREQRGLAGGCPGLGP